MSSNDYTEHNHIDSAAEAQLPYVGAHKHVCCFYRTHLEMERIWVAFIIEGLRQGQKCIVVVGIDYGVEEAVQALRVAGLNPNEHLENGSLVVANNQGFPTSATVKAEEVIVFWKARLTACNEGYQSVRVAAQMTWLSAAQRELDVVPEYEFLCNKLFLELPISALCMYDTAIFSEYQLNRVTAAHPYISTRNTVNASEVSSTTEFLLGKAFVFGK
ncbi:MAG TPA: MEDS domain-containing protein [Candidatus Obscuribacterales bacterium]